MIQGGRPHRQGNGGPGYTIKDDPSRRRTTAGRWPWPVASAPDSTGSQFFIVLSDDAAPSLASANTYMILGEVTAGMDAVDAIYADADSGSQTTPRPSHRDDQRDRHQSLTEGDAMTRATIATDLGDIEVQLYTTDVPKAAGNFVELAKKGFYDDVVFHRVIPGFVAQAGDGEHGKKATLDTNRVGTGGPGYKFADEPFKGDYVRGALAMANAGPNTNGSQFFICHQDLTGKLPKNYTLFGRS